MFLCANKWRIQYPQLLSTTSFPCEKEKQPQTVPWPSDSRDWPRGCGVRPLPQDVPSGGIATGNREVHTRKHTEVPTNESSKKHANTGPS